MNIRLLVSYNGENFHGFQAQDTGNAVQNYLYSAIYTALRLKNDENRNIQMSAAGRTDTGVHAFNQVINFHINIPKALREGFVIPGTTSGIETELFDLPPEKKSPSYYHKILKENEKEILRKINNMNKQRLYRLGISLNALLPDNINIHNPFIMPAFFHSRFSCLYRLYHYYVLNSPQPRAFWKGRALHIPGKLDVEKMLLAVKDLHGEKDFAAFTKLRYKEERTSRYMEEIKIYPLPSFPEVLVFSFRASGFLHNMIRILLAALLEVGRGRQKPQYISQVLQSKDRLLAPATAKPCGLYFAEAGYNPLNEI